VLFDVPYSVTSSMMLFGVYMLMYSQFEHFLGFIGEENKLRALNTTGVITRGRSLSPLNPHAAGYVRFTMEPLSAVIAIP